MGSRTALVTGATVGIGRSFAHQLAARGHDLVLVARDAPRLQHEAELLTSRHGCVVEVIVADLTDREQLATVEARLSDDEHPIDLLVNNAGFGLKDRFLDHSVEDEQAMLDVLVVAVMRLSHAALSSMAGRGHGGVINVASVAAFLPRGTYGAAKAWVVSFGEWAAAEYRPRGVTVTTVCPGFTRTEFHARMDVAADSAPGFMWLDACDLVRQTLRDHDRGRPLSVPGVPYKAIVGVAHLVPPRVLLRFQSLGRR
ncbi:SDR family NAD(P)-dependent oxidoreductase [Nocardioides gilvus]|uniref:SDR family NAD(P)-dependent oxidoreductase n=1 Tax=Nocardioides gilvus TaxID=1735589 RepID=UPI000D7437FD|nr:SDR family oxidoreductase [Nocardioides gilvus]